MPDGDLKLCRKPGGKRVRVALLVNNTCVYDSRVIRSAESLARAGADVVVICRSDPGLPLVERRNNVVYCRVDVQRSTSWFGYARMCRRAIDDSRLKQAGVAPGGGGTTHGADGIVIPRPDRAAPTAEARSAGASKATGYCDDVGARLPDFLRTAVAGGGIVMLNGSEFTALRRRVRMRYASRYMRLFEFGLSPFLALERRLAGPANDVEALPAWKRRILRLQLICLGAIAIGGRAVYRRGGRLRRKMRPSRLVRGGPRWFRQLAWSVYRRMPEGIGLRMRVRGFAIPVVGELTAFEPDIVHANELNTLQPAVLYAGLPEAGKVRIVYDSHELEAERDRIDSQFSRRMIRRYEAGLIRKTDAVITVSESIAQHLRDSYGVARPTVVYNAPSVTEIDASPSHRDLRAEAGVDPDTPLGVYVGRLKLGRGQELIIEALTHAPEMHLALVGPRPPKAIVALREHVERLGLGARVHFIDPVGVDQVVGFVAAADLGIVPTQNKGLSYAYAMPNKLFEMTLAGLPVIGGRLPEICRYIETTGTGILMDETDPADIGRAMREVYAYRARYASDARRRRELAETYSWSAQERRLIEVYQRLLDADGLQCSATHDRVDLQAAPARRLAR